MKHLIPQALQTAMRKYLPSCIVSYEFQSDQYVIENPVNGMAQRVSHEALHSAPSLSELAHRLSYDMGKRFEHELKKRGGVGFYGDFYRSCKPPIGREFELKMLDDVVKKQSQILEKENTKMLPEATCPRCLAPEEQEITVVDKVFSVSAVVEGEAQTRKFIVNAFSPLDAINFAVEILQDEAEDGAEVTARQVSAVEMPNTDILL